MAQLTNSIVNLLTFIPRMLLAIVIRKFRLKGQQAQTAIDLIKEHGHSFVTYSEECTDRLPAVHDAWCIIDKIPIRIAVIERMMRAGGEGTDTIIELTTLRLATGKWLRLLKDAEERGLKESGVYLLCPWDRLRIGRLSTAEGIPQPYMDGATLKRITDDVEHVLAGGRNKTGILLHGPPGNGKSYLIRYLALQYHLPICIVSLDSEISSTNLIKMLGNVSGPALVVLEDFDTFFNKRECLLKGARFTLDAIFNLIDGVFTTPDRLIFAMTANDINKIDDAIKCRPSRFRFVECVDNPDAKMRRRALNGLVNIEHEITATRGMSLDQVLRYKEDHETGLPINVDPREK